MAVVTGVTRLSWSMGSVANKRQLNLTAGFADLPLGRYRVPVGLNTTKRGPDPAWPLNPSMKQTKKFPDQPFHLVLKNQKIWANFLFVRQQTWAEYWWRMQTRLTPYLTHNRFFYINDNIATVQPVIASQMFAYSISDTSRHLNDSKHTLNILPKTLVE